MRNSAHYGLKLPERDDQYNIDDFNENFTAIDKAMSDNASAAEESMRAVSEEAEARGKTDADERAARERAVGDLDSALSTHKGDKANPHSVTKAQVGLSNVENKSSATIRGEITEKNVTDALGYTPAKTSEVPGAQSVFDAVRPVGSTYVQYPQQDDPNTLYNKNGLKSTWTVINYDGAFFRAQGTNAEQFIDKNGVLKKQDGQNKSHTHSVSGTTEGMNAKDKGTFGPFRGAKDESQNYYTGAFNIEKKNITVDGWEDASSSKVIGVSMNIAHTHDFSATSESSGGDECRPNNYTIRIWKRTA